jgi:hypothetical protein
MALAQRPPCTVTKLSSTLCRVDNVSEHDSRQNPVDFDLAPRTSEEFFDLADDATDRLRFIERNLMTPRIFQIGPKTSAKSGCSCSMPEKRCISGRSLASGIMGIRS